MFKSVFFPVFAYQENKDKSMRGGFKLTKKLDMIAVL